MGFCGLRCLVGRGILMVMETIARNILFIAIGVVAEAAIIFVLRHSWGWLSAAGYRPVLW